MVNIEEHLALVHYKAKKFHKTCEELCDYEDLVSAGYLGLCKAAIKFDESKGFQFSTLAGDMIYWEMQDLLLKDKHNFRRITKGKKQTYERVYVNSLNKSVGDSEDDREMIELIADSTDSYFDIDMKITFQKFDEKERKILDLYFNKNLTQVEIAKAFNITQVQVCRKIKKCLNTLKEAI